jgi:hypothetical protein
MKTFKQILSLLLCLQLTVSCNSGGGEVASPVKTRNAPVPTQETQEVEISGSIAKSFQFLSDVFLSSAVAAEGTISLYDISSIDNPQLVESQEISGTDQFSFKIKKDQVNEKFLKIAFESREGAERSRIFLLIPDGSPRLSLELNQETSIQHELAESRIRIQLGNGDLLLEDVKSAFQELQQPQKEDVMYLLGSKDLMLALLSHPELGSSAKEVISYFSTTPEASRWDYLAKLTDLAQRLGGSEPVLNCHGKNFSLIMPESQKFTLYFSPLNPEASKFFGSDDINLGDHGEFMSATKTLYKMVEQLSNHAEEIDMNLGARIWIETENGDVSSCNVFSREIVDLSIDQRLFDELKSREFSNLEEAFYHLNGAYDQTLDEFHRKLEASGFKSDSPAYYRNYDYQISKLKKLHEIYAKEFQSYLK